MSVYLICADDTIIHRCDDRQFALGYAACHVEQTGEEVEVFEVAPVATLEMAKVCAE